MAAAAAMAMATATAATAATAPVAATNDDDHVELSGHDNVRYVSKSGV